MGAFTFVAQDSVGATHTFQVGLINTAGGTNAYTPTLLTVDGFSGVAGGNLEQATTLQTTADFVAVDSTGEPHTYTVQFTPNAGIAGISDGTVWAPSITQVHGANPNVLGNLDSAAAAGTTA